MIKKALLGTMVAGLLGFAGSANAGLYVDNTSVPAASVPTVGNDYTGITAGTTVLEQGQLASQTAGTVSVWFVGNEAGYTQTFWFNGANVYTVGPAGGIGQPFGDSNLPVGTYAVSAGLLNFTFCTSGGPDIGTVVGPDGSLRCVRNNNAANISEQLAGVTNNGVFDNRGIAFLRVDANEYLVFWDDSGGVTPGQSTGVDDNHDDAIFRIRFNVPEPGTLALMGLGLMGLGFGRRRKAD